MTVDADQFARLCVQAGHKREAIEVVVRKRYPDADAAKVVQDAFEWREKLDADLAKQPK